MKWSALEELLGIGGFGMKIPKQIPLNNIYPTSWSCVLEPQTDGLRSAVEEQELAGGQKGRRVRPLLRAAGR